MPYSDPARQRAAKAESARRRRAAASTRASAWPKGGRLRTLDGLSSVVIRATAEHDGDPFPVQLQFGTTTETEGVVLPTALAANPLAARHPYAVAFRQWADAIDAGRDPWNQ